MSFRPEIKLIEKVNLKNCTLIEGFPGIGLVGTIAAGYLVEKLHMRVIGYVACDRFPPIASVHHGKPSMPARLYKHPTKNFCVLVAEFVVPTELVYPMADAILDFVKQHKIKQVVSLAGMTGSAETASQKPRVYGIASTDEIVNYLKLKGVPLIEEGVTTGVSGVLSAKCAAENLPAMSLLIEAGEYPDPHASAVIVERLGSLIGLEVDTKALLKEATTLNDRMKRIIDQMKKTKDSYKKAEDYPLMYE